MQSSSKLPSLTALFFIFFIITSTTFAAKKDIETKTFSARFDEEILELKQKNDQTAVLSAKGLSLILSMPETKGLLNKSHIEKMAKTAHAKIPSELERSNAIDVACSIKAVDSIGDFSGYVVKTELNQYGVTMTNHLYILSNGEKVFTVSAAIEVADESDKNFTQVELFINSLKIK